MSPLPRDVAFSQMLEWLASSELTVEGDIFDKLGPQEGGRTESIGEEVQGLPVQRYRARTRRELVDLETSYRSREENRIGQSTWAAIWQELRKPTATVRSIAPERIPADAIAWYRPFHVEPFHQWGIYIVVERLLDYCRLFSSSLGRLQSFPQSVVTSMALFDVFHHEFFHHLVECAATTVEIISSGKQRPVAVYLPYRRRVWAQYLGDHPHDPLEEALANAYSYNSFTFASKVGYGFLSRTSIVYQLVMERCWPDEPPGYRAAGYYTKGNQIDGAQLLLARMFSLEDSLKDLPIEILVQAVFPRGHTAFAAKPDIPTYLLGTEADVGELKLHIPAPVETYSRLYWPGDTDGIDAFLKEQKRLEREAKKPSRERSDVKAGLPF